MSKSLLYVLVMCVCVCVCASMSSQPSGYMQNNTEIEEKQKFVSSIVHIVVKTFLVFYSFKIVF
jgi:hypothetical protein